MGDGQQGQWFEVGVDDDSERHPAVITEVTDSPERQHRDRVRKYTILMACRVPALIIAAWVYSEFNNPIWAILILGASIPLPWIAVLIANDRPPRKRTRQVSLRGPQFSKQTALDSSAHPVING